MIENSLTADALENAPDDADATAASFYRVASMLVGESEEAVALIEQSVAQAEVSGCENQAEAHQNVLKALAENALVWYESEKNQKLEVPDEAVPAGSCIEDDDLSSAGIDQNELNQLLNGQGKASLRDWLESLPLALRFVFVLRAVAGLSSQQTAEVFAEQKSSETAVWTVDAVRELFRQALCSLANQLVHARAER